MVTGVQVIAASQDWSSMHNPAFNNKHSHGVEWIEAYLILHMKPCRRQVLIGGNMIQSHATVVQGFAVSLQYSWNEKRSASLYGSLKFAPTEAMIM